MNTQTHAHRYTHTDIHTDREGQWGDLFLKPVEILIIRKYRAVVGAQPSSHAESVARSLGHSWWGSLLAALTAACSELPVPAPLQPPLSPLPHGVLCLRWVTCVTGTPGDSLPQPL